jgi:hypothetical protein
MCTQPTQRIKIIGASLKLYSEILGADQDSFWVHSTDRVDFYNETRLTTQKQLETLQTLLNENKKLSDETMLLTRDLNETIQNGRRATQKSRDSRNPKIIQFPGEAEELKVSSPGRSELKQIS